MSNNGFAVERDPLFNENNLIWMDLEMTGLEPQINRILEMAAVITDSPSSISSYFHPDLQKKFQLHLVRLLYDWIQISHKYFLQQLSRLLFLKLLQLSFSSYF